jgi:hypothetical protein
LLECLAGGNAILAAYQINLTFQLDSEAMVNTLKFVVISLGIHLPLLVSLCQAENTPSYSVLIVAANNPRYRPPHHQMSSGWQEVIKLSATESGVVWNYAIPARVEGDRKMNRAGSFQLAPDLLKATVDSLTGLSPELPNSKDSDQEESRIIFTLIVLDGSDVHITLPLGVKQRSLLISGKLRPLFEDIRKRAFLSKRFHMTELWLQPGDQRQVRKPKQD